MSEEPETTEEATLWDAPNQQVVRRDASAPWESGDGGEPGPNDPQTPVGEQTGNLDDMSKADLLERARELGVSPANNDMTKEELRAGIDAKLAEG